MEQYAHFSHRQYDNKVFVLTEHYAPGRSHSFGAIWSRERCVAINPGLGLFGDVRKRVEALVGFEKAIYALGTDGTPWSVGAFGLFDEAFVNEPDLDLAKESMAPAARLAALKHMTETSEVLDEAKDDNIVDNSRFDPIGVHDPRILRSPDSFDHFHLGGIHLGAEPLPGFTPGSVVLSVHGDDTINCMFCGKSLTAGLNDLRNVDRDGFSLYIDSLKTLLAHTADYESFPLKRDNKVYFFSAEDPRPFFKDVPQNLVKGAEELLSGKTAGDIPATCGDRNLKLHIAGFSTILYDPALL